MVKYTNDEEVSLLIHKHISDYMRLLCFPIKKECDIIYIAYCYNKKDVEEWANKIYGSFHLIQYNKKEILEYLYNTHKSYCLEHSCNLFAVLHKAISIKNINEYIPFILFIVIFVLLPFITFSGVFINELILVSNVLYFLSNLFSIFVFISSGDRDNIQHKDKKEDYNYKFNDIYTILVPLYKEAKVFPKLLASLNNIDYPRNLLDIKFLIEENDIYTKNAIKSSKLPLEYEVITVPYKLPLTKPKACNYGLLFARGKYVTIYDAEDVPDKLQLKKVIRKFHESSDNVACIQCRLNYFNKDRNILTYMFSIEYGVLFNHMLPGLKNNNMFIPLGGTSNHFKIDVIKQLGAWDPNNVTEDAEMGIRLLCQGYQIELLESFTMEESVTNITSWIKQRSRWIKGYIQTYIVYFLYLQKYMVNKDDYLINRALSLNFFIGIPMILFPISIYIWISLIMDIIGVYTINQKIVHFCEINFFLGIIINVYSAFNALYYSAIHSKDRLLKKIILSICYPVYRLLHPLASFKSFWEVFFKPFHWSKTEHGE